MADLLIHIGYHKTATSWLQKFLFTNPAAGFISTFRITKLRKLLVYPHAFDFEPGKCRLYFRLACGDTGNDGLVNTISFEGLSGNPHSGGYNSKELADRLSLVFPTARVLVVIREQKSMILSTYKQYVKGGGSSSLRDYLHPPDIDRFRVPLFDFDHFKYDRLIGYYIGLFGRANVLVLPYELFKVEPQTFIREVMRFCSCKAKSELIEALPYSSQINQSLSGFAIALKRRLNGVIVEKCRLNLNPVFPVRGVNRRLKSYLYQLDIVIPRSLKAFCDRKLQARICEIVGDRYRQSNSLTSKMLNLDLAQYGYEVEGNKA